MKAAERSSPLWMWLLLPLCTVLYHIAAKETGSCWQGTGTGTGTGAALRCMLHAPWFRVMVISDVGGFIAWMYVLRRMKLSAAFPMSAISYVIVMAISWWFYREAFGASQIIGSALIIAGVFLIGGASESPR